MGLIGLGIEGGQEAGSAGDGHLLMWAAASQLQAGEVEAARALTRQALRAGLDRRAAARLLLGGAFLQLGRATLLAERPDWALRLLRQGLELGVPGGTALCQDLLMAEAERCSQRGAHQEAEQRWQAIAGLLGEKTPALVHRRLGEAKALSAQGRGGRLASAATRRALVLTNHLHSFAGSELVALEVAETLVDMGFAVDVIANKVSASLIESTYPSITLSDDIRLKDADAYDLIWSQHNLLPMIDQRLGRAKDRTRIFSVHLSPFDPFELTGLSAAILSNARFIVNSPETCGVIQSLGVPPSAIHNFQNAAPARFHAAFNTNQPRALETLLVVSNHPPPELMQAIDALRSAGVEVIGLGRPFGVHRRVLPADISAADAIVTIGKTVQYGILAGTPVYCYDRFGGPGWIVPDSIETAASYNFSGRCCYRKLDAEQLVSELQQQFSWAQGFSAALRAQYADQYRLDAFISKLLELPAPTYHLQDYPYLMQQCLSANGAIIRKWYRKAHARSGSSLPR